MTIDDCIELYCAAWNEPLATRRMAMLAPIWTDDTQYTDPTVHAVGRQALSDHIDGVLARLPGSVVVCTTALDVHHDVLRFGWKRVLADGSVRVEGIDIVEFAADHTLRRVIGFFGPMAPGEPNP